MASGIPRSGNLADFGKSLPQRFGLIAAPGEGASVAQVVGEALRAPGLTEDLAEGPGFHGLLRVAVGFEADDLVETLDCLAVEPGPRQAQGTIKRCLGIVAGLGGQAAEGLGGISELRGLAVTQHAIPPRLAALRSPASGSDRPCVPPGEGRGPLRASPAPAAPRSHPDRALSARCQVPQAASGRCDIRWFQPSCTRASVSSCVAVAAIEASSPIKLKLSRFSLSPLLLPGQDQPLLTALFGSLVRSRGPDRGALRRGLGSPDLAPRRGNAQIT